MNRFLWMAGGMMLGGLAVLLEERLRLAEELDEYEEVISALVERLEK